MRLGLGGTFACVALAGCGGAKAPPAPPTPTTLVTTEMPAQGSLPDMLPAYGSAVPTVTATRTLSVPQPGQVTQLMVTPGTTVRGGQPLVTFTATPTSVSAFTQAQTALSSAQRQRATTAQLLGQQLATRDQLAQTDKAVADATAALNALRAEGAGAAVRMLVAPFDGTVTAIPVAQGDRVQSGAALITVARAGGIVVTAGIDPAQRTRVRVGAPATLVRLTGGAPLHGRVVRVDSVLNSKTRQVNVDLGFPAGAILPGEALQVGIRAGDIRGWLVPHRAVVTATGSPHIFQIAGGKAVAVKVTDALATPGQDIVQGPLDAARPLIVDGAYQVEAGGAVRVGRR